MKMRAAILLLTVLCTVMIAQPSRAQQGQVVDPAFSQLTTGNVYVEDTLNRLNKAGLEQAAMQGSDNPHTKVKIAVLENLPQPYVDRTVYAHILAQSIGLGKNALIVVVMRQPHRGVTVVSSTLSKSEVYNLEK